MEHHTMKEGMNVIETPNNAGSMHIMVRGGQVCKVILFNAKVSKKTTRTNQYKGETLNHVTMQIKTDW